MFSHVQTTKKERYGLGLSPSRREKCFRRETGCHEGHSRMVGKAKVGYTQWGSQNADCLVRQWMPRGLQKTSNDVGWTRENIWRLLRARSRQNCEFRVWFEKVIIDDWRNFGGGIVGLIGWYQEIAPPIEEKKKKEKGEPCPFHWPKESYRCDLTPPFSLTSSLGKRGIDR